MDEPELFPAGSTLREIAEGVASRHVFSEGTADVRVVWEGGLAVEEEDFEAIPSAGSAVHIRAIPGFGIVEAIIGGIAAAASAVAAGVTGVVLGLLGFTAITGVGLTGVGVSVMIISWSFGGLVTGLMTIAAVASAIYGVVASLTGSQGPRLGTGALQQGPSAVRPGSGGTTSASQSPTISGARNQPRPWEPVWQVYGKHRVTPPVVGIPYIDVIKGKVVLRMLLHFGPGAVKLSNIKIGDTILVVSPNTGSISNPDTTNFRKVQYAYVEGWEGDDLSGVKSIYPGAVTTSEFQVKVAGPQIGAGRPDNTPRVRTTAQQTNRVSLEMSYNGFQAASASGEFHNVTHGWRVRYGPTGSDLDVTGVLPSKAVHNFNVTGAHVTGNGKFKKGKNTPNAHFVQVEFDIPEGPGQFDVELFNIKPVPYHPFLSADCFWAGMTSFTDGEPLNLPTPQCLLAIKIQASNQISGTVENLSAECERYLPKLDGSGNFVGTYPPTAAQKAAGDWILTRNAALAFGDVLRGTEQREPLAPEFIDGPRIQEWHDVLEAGTRNFDAVIDFAQTNQQTLNDIAGAGRASLFVRDMKISVVLDRDTRLEDPVDHINPRRMIQGSFEGQFAHPNVPHAYRVRFLDESLGWAPGERLVFRSGYAEEAGGGDLAAETYEETEIWGVTDANEAYEEGRLRMNRALLRRQFFTFGLTIQHLLLERGDVVLVSHDAALIGETSAYILQSLPQAVQSSDHFRYVAGRDYAVTIRNLDGEVINADVTNPATGPDVYSDVAIFVTPLVSAPDLYGLLTFGERDVQTRRCVVLSVDVNPDLTALVECAEEAGGAWDLDTPPVYDPGIGQPYFAAPSTPRITGVTRTDAGFEVTIAPIAAAGTSVAVPARTELTYLLDDRASHVNSTPTPPDLDDEDWTTLPSFEGVEERTITVPMSPLAEEFWVWFIVRSESDRGVSSLWSEPARFWWEAPAGLADRYKVKGLEIAGQGANTRFDETQFEIQWELVDTRLGFNPFVSRPAYINLFAGFGGGKHNVPARPASPFPTGLYYEVSVADPTSERFPNGLAEPVRVDRVHELRYTYGLDKQVVDWTNRGVEKVRQLQVGVRAAAIDGSFGDWSFIEVRNPPPRKVSIIWIRISAAGQPGMTIAAQRPSVGDLAGVLVWAASTSTYPDPDNMPLDETTLQLDSAPSAYLTWEPPATGPHWVKVAYYDTFSRTDLDPSDAFEVDVPPIALNITTLLAAKAVTTSTATSVTVGGPNGLSASAVIGNRVRILADTAITKSTSLAAGQAREITGYTDATGKIDIATGDEWENNPSASDGDEAEILDVSGLPDDMVDGEHIPPGSIGTPQVGDTAINEPWVPTQLWDDRAVGLRYSTLHHQAAPYKASGGDIHEITAHVEEDWNNVWGSVAICKVVANYTLAGTTSMAASGVWGRLSDGTDDSVWESRQLADGAGNATVSVQSGNIKMASDGGTYDGLVLKLYEAGLGMPSASTHEVSFKITVGTTINAVLVNFRIHDMRPEANAWNAQQTWNMANVSTISPSLSGGNMTGLQQYTVTIDMTSLSPSSTPGTWKNDTGAAGDEICEFVWDNFGTTGTDHYDMWIDDVQVRTWNGHDEGTPGMHSTKLTIAQTLADGDAGKWSHGSSPNADGENWGHYLVQYEPSYGAASIGAEKTWPLIGHDTRHFYLGEELPASPHNTDDHSEGKGVGSPDDTHGPHIPVEFYNPQLVSDFDGTDSGDEVIILEVLASHKVGVDDPTNGDDSGRQYGLSWVEFPSDAGGLPTDESTVEYVLLGYNSGLSDTVLFTGADLTVKRTKK